MVFPGALLLVQVVVTHKALGLNRTAGLRSDQWQDLKQRSGCLKALREYGWWTRERFPTGSPRELQSSPVIGVEHFPEAHDAEDQRQEDHPP
jgi:hypothetical protein